MHVTVLMFALFLWGEFALPKNLVKNPVSIPGFSQIGAEEFPCSPVHLPEQIPHRFCPCMFYHHAQSVLKKPGICKASRFC